MKKAVIDTNVNQDSFNSEINTALHKICSVPLIEHIILQLKEENTEIFVAGESKICEYFASREDVHLLGCASDAPKDCTYIPITKPYVCAEEEFSCCSREEFCILSEFLKRRINKKVMEKGVTIISPESTYISPFAQIGQDSVIYPDVHIEGNSRVGANCIIYSGTTVENSVIGDNTVIRSSVIIKSIVGDNTTVGPFAYIRPDCRVGNFVKVGDFVELKNAQIGNKTKISHLTYVGDSTVGENVNFGCGTVTVNYDGANKFRTQIGDNVFIGCNTNLVAPVTVGDNSFIAAGSTITDEVPENGFSIARARQINKENWVKPKDRK